MLFRSLASITKDRGQNELLRENQRLMVVLTARLENRDLGSAIADVKRVLASEKLPVGYTYEIGGQYESQQSSFRELLFVLGQEVEMYRMYQDRIAACLWQQQTLIHPRCR